MTTTETIIQIEDLKKIFYTDEIETHALSGVHLNINRGEYVAMSMLQDAVSLRSCRSSGCSTLRQAAATH